MRKLLTAIIIISVIAMLTSGYLVFLHYAGGQSPCDMSEGVSCDVINKSAYSGLFGIPIAFLSFLAFLAIFILSLLILNNGEIRLFGLRLDRKVYARIILFLMIVSVPYSIYLIYVQAVMLLSYCIFCLFLDLLIYISFVLAIVLNLNLR